MYCWTLVIVAIITGAAPQDSTSPTASQPTTRRSSLRKPYDAELLSRLLRDKEATTPLLPVMPDDRIGARANGNRAAARGDVRLPEGVRLVGRTGRLVRDGDNSYFEFDALEPNRALKRMRIHPNALLEQMERKMTQGAKTFKISAETTLYRGENYLLLKKEDAIMSGGNLSP